MENRTGEAFKICRSDNNIVKFKQYKIFVNTKLKNMSAILLRAYLAIQCFNQTYIIASCILCQGIQVVRGSYKNKEYKNNYT